MSESSFSKLALPLGMSYIVFRLIHYIVEIYRKSLPNHTFWDLALYVFFFPTFIAGPVERFQKFHPQTIKNKSLDPSDINYGLFRIMSGLLKKFVIADNMAPVIMPLLNSPDDSSRILVILAIYGLAIQVYMDFSGYTDMALGISRLFGYKIVENFNYPFFKKNIALFWRNWHMSVYSFIRDYFFFPFFAYRASQLKIYIGMLMTLVVFMLWHELSWPYLLAGVYHGTGLVIWQFFQEVKGKNPGLRKMVDNRYVDPVSTFLTFNFVSLSMIIFYFDTEVIKNILYKIFL
jgi:alginate O-acetyltransferase complex protein AlgI